MPNIDVKIFACLKPKTSLLSVIELNCLLNTDLRDTECYSWPGKYYYEMEVDSDCAGSGSDCSGRGGINSLCLSVFLSLPRWGTLISEIAHNYPELYNVSIFRLTLSNDGGV